MRKSRQPSRGGPVIGRDGVWVLCMAAGAAAFALWLRQAAADQPRFLLAPVSALAGLLTGVPFTLQPGLGYGGVTHTGALVRVSKVCAGGNFLIILFLLLALTQLRKAGTIPGRAALCAGLLGFSYLVAVAASALRVAATVLLTGAGLPMSWELMHNTVGIATYVTMLCGCYLAVERGLSGLRQVWTERAVSRGG